MRPPGEGVNNNKAVCVTSNANGFKRKPLSGIKVPFGPLRTHIFLLASLLHQLGDFFVFAVAFGNVERELAIGSHIDFDDAALGQLAE